MPDNAELTDVDSLAVDAIQGLISPPSLVATNFAGLDDERDHLLADPVDALGSVVEDVAEMVTHPADTAQAAAQLALEIAEDIATTAGELATGAVDAAEWSVGAAEHLGGAVVDAGTAVMEDAIEALTHPADSAEAVVETVGDVVETVGDVAEGVVSLHLDVAETALGVSEDAVEGAAWVVTHPEQAIVDAGEAIVSEADQWTGGAASSIVDQVGEALDGVDDATGNVVSDTYETISDGVTDAADSLGGAFADAGAALGSVFGSETVGTGEDRTSDSDSDGVTDWDERHVHGTDPGRWDTDGDGLSDGRELREYGTDPTAGDSDTDGLADGEELRRGTDPFSWDTDGDGWSDGMEARYTDTDPLRRDTDGDGLTDRDEGMVHRTDPKERDSDGDGLRDGQELERGYDPNAGDTDRDGIGDGAQAAFDDGTWMDEEASALDAAGALEAAGGVVLEENGVVEHGTDPLQLDVAQPYGLLDEADLTVRGHDPLPVAGTLDDARSSVAEPEQSVQSFGLGDPNAPNINDPSVWPSLKDAVLTTVDQAPTEALPPSPIHDAITTPDGGISTEALPPKPSDEASGFDAAGVRTSEAAGDAVLEDGGVVEHRTDPLDLDVVQPYGLLDEADLAVGGHDPLPVAGTLEDARGELGTAHEETPPRPWGSDTEPDPLGRPQVPPELRNDPFANLKPPGEPAVDPRTTVDQAPTEALPPTPIDGAVTTLDADAGTLTEALPPNPIHEDVTSWDAVDALPEPLVNSDAHLELEADLGDATPSFEPGALDSELDFGG